MVYWPRYNVRSVEYKLSGCFTSTKFHFRPGQTCLSSLSALLPVILSGHASNGLSTPTGAQTTGGVSPNGFSLATASPRISSWSRLCRAFRCCFTFGGCFDAKTTLGFSKATLRRSICSSNGSISCAMRARTAQSRPPEKRMASLTLAGPSERGGSGIFSRRNRNDCIICCSSCLTESDDRFRDHGVVGTTWLRTPRESD